MATMRYADLLTLAQAEAPGLLLGAALEVGGAGLGELAGGGDRGEAALVEA